MNAARCAGAWWLCGFTMARKCGRLTRLIRSKEIGKNSAGRAQYGPSGAGVWSAPTLDLKRGVLYVTTGDNYSQPATKLSDAVLALEIKTGRIAWSRQLV